VDFGRRSGKRRSVSSGRVQVEDVEDVDDTVSLLSTSSIMATSNLTAPPSGYSTIPSPSTPHSALPGTSRPSTAQTGSMQTMQQQQTQTQTQARVYVPERTRRGRFFPDEMVKERMQQMCEFHGFRSFALSRSVGKGGSRGSGLRRADEREAVDDRAERVEACGGRGWEAVT
jgi:hypothetical protein